MRKTRKRHCDREAALSSALLYRFRDASRRRLQRFADETGLVVSVAHLPPAPMEPHRAPPLCPHLLELARPEADQDEAAEILLSLASKRAEPVHLDEEIRQAVREGKAQAGRGEFASDEEMAAFFNRRGG